jgi:AraC-like DNA-binding protein
MTRSSPSTTEAPPSLLRGPALTPMAFVQAIAWAYAHRGMDPAKALAAAQIAPDVLHDSQARITAAQMERISEHAMRELDDEALGWFGRRLPWGSYGMLARASISAPRLGVALQRWCRHHGLIAPDISLALEVAGDVATIRIVENNTPGGWAAWDAAQVKEEPAKRAGDTEQSPLPPTLREFCLVSVLRNIHGLACWLIDSRIPLQGAQFPFAAPPHHDVYRVLFSGPTAFDTAPAGIHFDARYLALPLRRDEAALKQMLQRALPLTVLQYRRDRLLVQRVRQALAAHPGATHSAENLAAMLNLSARTLHRQLKDEGAALQALKDEVRRARALELLLRTHRPIKQVAEAAGFQNEKSFMRAFRGWTGQSPAEFRRAGTSLH